MYVAGARASAKWEMEIAEEREGRKDGCHILSDRADDCSRTEQQMGSFKSRIVQGSRYFLGQRFCVLCFEILHSLHFLPICPLWCKFQNKTGTEPLTQ